MCVVVHLRSHLLNYETSRGSEGSFCVCLHERVSICSYSQHHATFQTASDKMITSSLHPFVFLVVRGCGRLKSEGKWNASSRRCSCSVIFYMKRVIKCLAWKSNKERWDDKWQMSLANNTVSEWSNSLTLPHTPPGEHHTIWKANSKYCNSLNFRDKRTFPISGALNLN